VSQLLSESNLKLAAVADKAGFENPEHMCRLFKKKYGMTPGEFRNRTTLSG
jgi:AraC-like DNA-binding protein